MVKRRFREDRGQELVEYAIVFVLLFTIILGIIEFATIIFSQNSVANVAREGARFAVPRYSPAIALPAPGDEFTETCSSAIDPIVQAACSKALALDLEHIEVTVSRPSGASSGAITVLVEYDYSPFFAPIGAFLPGGTIQLGSQSTMRLE